MRICIVSVKGDLDALREKFISEGDSLVALGEECDLTLSDDPKIFGDGVISFGYELPSMVLQGAGFETSPLGEKDHALARWFSWRDGWLDQTMLVCPLMSLYNWDLGVRCPGGSVIKFIHSASANALFENVMVTQVLQEMKHTGFVTMWRSRRGRMISLETGLPHYAIYGLVEGMRQKLSRWMTQPEPVLESWISCILVSRHPYPQKERSERIEVTLDEDMLRHTWLFEPQKLPGRSITTERTRVCVVTSWDHSLRESVARALNTAWNIGCENKQFRTDLMEKALDVVTRLETEGMI